MNQIKVAVLPSQAFQHIADSETTSFQRFRRFYDVGGVTLHGRVLLRKLLGHSFDQLEDCRDASEMKETTMIFFNQP